MSLNIPGITNLFKSAEQRQTDAIANALEKVNRDYDETFKGFTMYEDNPGDILTPEHGEVLLEGYRITFADYMQKWAPEDGGEPTKNTMEDVKYLLRMYPNIEDFFGQGEKGKLSIFDQENNQGYEGRYPAEHFFDNLRSTSSGRKVLDGIGREVLAEMQGQSPDVDNKSELHA